MKERPILFSAPMVRALLEGRKTQTRRIVKGVALDALAPDMFTPEFVALSENDYCPYGKPGDRLWVRETFSVYSVDPGTACLTYKERMPAGKTLAETDGGLDVIHLEPENWDKAYMMVDTERWRPSIHMPRWASRITLGITEVRVQRLQDISEEDSIAEGAQSWEFGPEQCLTTGERGASSPYRSGFACLWDDINADRATWKSNPWVWAVSFKAVTA